MRDTSLDAPSPTQSSRIAVGLRTFPGIRPLAADYSDNFGAVSSFFAASPWERAGWAQAIARAQARGVKRAELAAIIEAQQKTRGAPPAAVAGARRLAEPASVAVVTGQQAGLFGGPLYTLLKAITALRVAARVERDFGVPAVAVFWVESEDHDWEEVRTCTVAGETLAPVAVAVASRAGDPPARVADIRFDPSIVTALEALDGALPSTEFHAELMDRLREIYTPGASPSVSFAGLLERVLGGRGLVVYDASDLEAKPLARDVFVHELSAPGESARRTARAGEELASRGYHAQVQAADETVCLYYLDRGTRTPIRRRSDHFIVAERPVTASALADEAREHPERFSPNVLLRPIVQDALFPTAVYIPGPNELAYFAQLGSVYAHFGMTMPLLYPRPSATLVDSAALRFLTRYNFPFEALQRQDEAALNQLLASQMPEAVDKAYGEASRTVETAMASLIDAIPALDPTLEGAARSTLGKMQHDLQTLHGKMIQAAKRRDETLRRQYTRTRALAFPGGLPQERAIAFVSFLNQYGPALVDRLLQLLPLEPGHWVLTV